MSGGGGSGGFTPTHAGGGVGLGGLVFDDWFLVLLLFVAADCFQAHVFLYDCPHPSPPLPSCPFVSDRLHATPLLSCDAL